MRTRPSSPIPTVRFRDLFRGRNELVVYKHMWADGAPHQGQCPGYSTTGRGNERVNGTLGLLDMTPYGRGEAWEDNPEGRPEGRSSCWFWSSDAEGNATWGPTSRPYPD